MTATAATTTCPSWCVEDENYSVDFRQTIQHCSEALFWSESDRLAYVELERMGDEPTELRIHHFNGDFDFPVTAADLRRLAEHLVTLAGRLESAQ